MPEIIATISRSVELRLGDLITIGTPAGVGPVRKGEEMWVKIGGLTDCVLAANA